MWAKAQPTIRESPLGLLLDRALPDSKVVLSAFINVANNMPAPVAFVLDDYHLIEEPSIRRNSAGGNHVDDQRRKAHSIG